MPKSRNRKNKKINKVKTNIEYNIKAFWKGSVLSDINCNKKQYDELKKTLKIDFFTEPDQTPSDNIHSAIAYLDDIEDEYYREYQSTGQYSISLEDMTSHMLMINSIVNRGLRENDNNYGLVTMITKK